MYPIQPIPQDNLTLATKYVEIANNLKKLKAIEAELKARLLEQMTNAGLVSFKTNDFTITKANRVSITITDHAKVGKALDEMGVPVAYETVLTKPTQEAVKTLAKQQVAIEGVEASESTYITIRTAKKEETKGGR
jgi:hypothetical protein